MSSDGCQSRQVLVFALKVPAKCGYDTILYGYIISIKIMRRLKVYFICLFY